MRPATPTDSDLWKPEYLRGRGKILLTGTLLPDNTHRYRLLDPTAPFDLGRRWPPLLSSGLRRSQWEQHMLILRESAGAEPIRLHDDRQARVIAYT